MIVLHSLDDGILSFTLCKSVFHKLLLFFRISVTIGFLVIEFFHAYASKYNIQRRKLSSAKHNRYQFSFSHP